MEKHEHRWDRFAVVTPYLNGKAVSRSRAYVTVYSVCRDCGRTSAAGPNRISRANLPLIGQACVVAA